MNKRQRVKLLRTYQLLEQRTCVSINDGAEISEEAIALAAFVDEN